MVDEAAPVDDNTAPSMNSGDLVRRLEEIRQEKSGLNDSIKVLNEEDRELKYKLLVMMEEQGGATRVSFDGVTASRTEMVVPVIEDFDEFSEYVIKEGALHLLQRRVSSGEFKEMIESGQQVPGLSPYTKVDISIRKTK